MVWPEIVAVAFPLVIVRVGRENRWLLKIVFLKSVNGLILLMLVDVLEIKRRWNLCQLEVKTLHDDDG
jgi:hypothetical protein